MEYNLITPIKPSNEEFDIINQIFFNRGINPCDIYHYLNTTDDDILNPLLLENMQNGAKMLIKHIYNNDNILIQVDSDCDGFTSSALLINYLYCLFPAFVKNHIFYRLHEGKQHGIILDTISDDISLVIAPDSSSNDYEEHKALFEKGIDVLVIDHHEASEISKYACVINNQLCDYPNKTLSGAGVVFKFCSYIDSLLNQSYANLFIDLASLGIIGDMMDLRPFETKHIITKGLNSLRNPFFKEMVETQNFSISKHGYLDPFCVSFYVAPQINATIRMGTQEEKYLLFKSMLDFQAYTLIPSTKRGCKGQTETIVEQACRNCNNIKNKQTKSRDSALEYIKSIIKEKNLLSNKILIIQLENNIIDKNLTGLIANQLMSEYQRPVLLLNKNVQENGDISWEGSGRGYNKSKLTDFKNFLLQCPYCEYAEGHANAFGFGVLDKNFNLFLDWCNTTLKNFNFSIFYQVDKIYIADDMNINDVLKIANLKPIWGQEIEEPYIAIENIKITKDNLKLLSPDKNPTLKISLGENFNLIKFKSSEDEFNNLYSDFGCKIINVVGKCEKNIWGGEVNPQLIIEDYEIISEKKYYF